MLQMVRHINKDWQRACRRNRRHVLYLSPRQRGARIRLVHQSRVSRAPPALTAGNAGKNKPSTVAGLSALPGDPFTDYLLGSDNIRVQSDQALRGADYSSIKQTERTYGFMISITKRSA